MLSKTVDNRKYASAVHIKGLDKVASPNKPIFPYRNFFEKVGLIMRSDRLRYGEFSNSLPSKSIILSNLSFITCYIQNGHS